MLPDASLSLGPNQDFRPGGAPFAAVGPSELTGMALPDGSSGLCVVCQVRVLLTS